MWLWISQLPLVLSVTEGLLIASLCFPSGFVTYCTIMADDDELSIG